VKQDRQVELHLGKRLKRMRLECNLTQAEVGRECGVSRQRISQLERHPPKDIRYSTLKGMARACKQPIGDFINAIENHNGWPKKFW
jgi:transcriptional regulator with XRE-family HTH domain